MVHDTFDVLCWGPSEGHGARVVPLPDGLTQAASVVRSHLGDRPAPWLLFWHPRLGVPPFERLAEAVAGRVGDVWHGGLEFGTRGLPEEHDYIHPTTPFVLDPAPGVEATSWRLSLAAALVRTDALRAVGGIDPAFHGATGAGLELGRRLLEQGAVVRAAPWLVAGVGLLSEPVDEHDRSLFLRRRFGPKWVAYAGVRRAVATRHPVRVAAGWRSSARTHATMAPLDAALVERPPVEEPAHPQVSVVLPTLGRYDLLRPLLRQIVDQTVKPLEVLVVDQNEPGRRDAALYEGFAAHGVRVIWQEERGQWISRNAAVQQARGEWVAFVDDDSQIEPDFIAAHLEGIARYDAELSSGASLAVVGAPVPENYSYFRVADQWDSGNGMCRRELFASLGLFDEQYDRQRRGDAEFGLRVQLAGGLVLHNPRATRVHLKAGSGGLRTYGSWDGFRHQDRSGPLPVPSMLYYTARYHSPRQRREDLALGLVTGISPYHLKRRLTGGQWARLLASELRHVPSTVRRVRESRRQAARMVAEGPRIPALYP